MGLESGSIRNDRQAILRGVYEDNLRTIRKLGPEPPGRQASDGASSRGLSSVRQRLRSIGWVLGVVLALVGVSFQAMGIGRFFDESGVSAARATQLAPLPTDSLFRAQPTPTGWPDSLLGDPSVARLYGLQFQTIVIDPGHGGVDPGAIGQGGLKEKDITLDVARRLKARLERYSGYRILLTRDDDVKLTLRERIRFANEQRADLFLSIHFNSIPIDTLAPIETYYYGPGSDAKAKRLAQRENANSGYTLAEFNELTQQLGLELKIQESKELAVSIQKGLYRNMRRINENVSDWGAKSGDFMVLLGVQAPSVLAEIASISNPAQEAQLNTAEHRERLAMFLEEGIVSYLRQHATDNVSIDHATEEEE